MSRANDADAASSGSPFRRLACLRKRSVISLCRWTGMALRFTAGWLFGTREKGTGRKELPRRGRAIVFSTENQVIGIGYDGERTRGGGKTHGGSKAAFVFCNRAVPVGEANPAATRAGTCWHVLCDEGAWRQNPRPHTHENEPIIPPLRQSLESGVRKSRLDPPLAYRSSDSDPSCPLPSPRMHVITARRLRGD